MNEVNIYKTIIRSKSLNSTYCKNFAAKSLDDCIEMIKGYIEMIKTRQFAPDYTIIKLESTGTIIIETNIL